MLLFLCQFSVLPNGAKPDSMQLLVDKIDSLCRQVENFQIQKDYFTDILSHQWTVLSIQTGIFICIITIIIALLGYFSWRFFIKEHVDKLNRLDHIVQRQEEKFSQLDKLEHQLGEVARRALRALYQGPNTKRWKVIWHVRYLEWYFDRGFKDRLRKHCSSLDHEYKILKGDPAQFQEFLLWDNLETFKKLLMKLLPSEVSELSTIVIEILNDIKG